MRPSDLLDTHRRAIRQLVTQHGMANARVFGSALHGQDSDTSDLDLLVDPTARTTLMDLAALQIDVEALLGVRVDVVTPKSLPTSFRDRVVREAVAV